MNRLSEMLRLYFHTRGLRVRTLSKQIGISPATVSRLQRTGQMDLHTFLKVQAWLLSSSRARGPKKRSTKLMRA